MRTLIALPAMALALILLTASAPARAQCANALSPPAQLDPGNAFDLYEAGMAAMRNDRMDDADHLLRSGFAQLSDAPKDASATLEPMMLGRLIEVALQRSDLTTAMYRMKVLRERLAGKPDHPDWIDKVIKMADLATVAEQNRVAGSDETSKCRSFGVAVRSSARIRFAFGSAVIDEAARADLVQIARNLDSGGATKILVRGHTDARGNVVANVALSLRRARAVIAALFTIAPNLAGKLTAEGVGSREPLYSGDDEDSYRLNRRVEFTFPLPPKSP
ncbi:OmpA family protein [Novosphingobium sp.]|uniref:OmpA family protein n=1 Tax=Novosphingobium sp. TaxID=1874826 RepID=UPI003BAD4DF2